MKYDLTDLQPGHPVTINGITISIDQDDLAWDCLGDEPVDVFGRDSWGRNRLIHAGGANVPDWDMLVQIEREDWQDIAESLAYDCYERATGIVVWPDWPDHAVTFKSWRNAARGMLRRNGFDLDDIRIEQIAPEYHQTSDSFFVVWSQRQFDKYAGTKNAKVFTDYYQSILSGDVWYYCVTDDETEESESCGGFIGEYWNKYFTGEIGFAIDQLMDAKNERQARAIEESRPDMVMA